MAGEERPEAPQLLIEGELVALGPLRRDLIPVYQRWMNNLEVMRGVGRIDPVTLEAETAWYESTVREAARGPIFVIYDRSDLAPVGTCGINEAQPLNGAGTFGIMLGERRGLGLGTEATRLALDWAFNVLGLHNVMLQVFEWNVAAIRAYTKAGFKEIGRRRGGVVTMGRRFDIVLMDAVADEFEGSALARFVPEGGRPG
jgi:RimJ/RimL family protein N-acetyltransferase